MRVGSCAFVIAFAFCLEDHATFANIDGWNVKAEAYYLFPFVVIPLGAFVIVNYLRSLFESYWSPSFGALFVVPLDPSLSFHLVLLALLIT
jgi:hypothetical protein